MLKHRLFSRSVAMVATLAVAAAGVTLSGGLGAAASTTTDVGTLAATAGCGKAPGIASGTHTISSGGTNRSFILRIPANYNQNNPYRLVFGLHWWGGTAVDVDTGQTVDRNTWQYYGLQRLANNSTIFVAPQGLDNGWANTNGQDVTFIDNIISRLDAALCIDTTQRFSIGFSYGAAMSFALACARPTVFRAIVVQSAPRELSGCSGGTQPVAYLGVHGVSDTIASGRSMRDRFVRNNGCAAQSPREPSVGSLTHIVTTYSGCRAGYPVVWAAFDGGHIAAPQDGATGDSGTRTWVPALAWNFFTQFQSSPPPTTPPNTSPAPTTPPNTSPAPTTPVATTPPPSGGACTATYRTTNSWSGGFQGDVTVTAGSSPINGWTVRWTLGSGQSISQIWNGTLSASGSSATVRNVSYNGSLAASGSTTFGFLASGTPSNPALTCTSP